ncbi:MAG: fibronectin type III domain-containing protein [Spirochaetota bacterium]
MKKQTKISLLIFFFFIMANTAFAEYVFLRDGSIVKCKIESETAATITARLADGKQMTISPKNVIRILYTELYMGKIFINKTDGTVIEAYMVDEDQTTYTLRKELYKPQEFIIKRDEVLFTTRKNPSGLIGKAKDDRIEITWKAPYTPVNNYKVYFRSTGEFKLHGTTGSTSYTLKGLRGSTHYTIKVTAIDKQGDESLPTNEFKIKTENKPPDSPGYVRASVKPDKSGQKMTAKITWKAAFDADGSITGYRIYRSDVKGYTQVGETNKNTYEIKNLDADKSYRYAVRSIDDKNLESENSRLVAATLLKGYEAGVEFSYIKPFGDFKKINESGFGGLVSFSKTDALFYDMVIGLAVGYWKFSGATDVDSSYMIPLMATATYRYEAFDSFFIAPRVALGMSYNSVSYYWESPSFTGTKEKKSRSGIEPIVMAGLSFNYEFADYWTVGLGANYGFVYETDGLMNFVTGSLTAARKF